MPGSRSRTMHANRNSSRVRHDQRMPVSHYYGWERRIRTPMRNISTVGGPDDENPQTVRNSGRNAAGLLHALLTLWGRHFQSIRRRNFGLHHAGGVLGASQHKKLFKGVSEEQFGHINKFLLNEQRKSWVAFGKDPAAADTFVIPHCLT